MYAIDWASLLKNTHRNCSACATCPHTSPADTHAATKSRILPAVSPTVWALGFTSFFTDVSSEMVASVLPMYLVLQLHLSPATFGIIDGLYQGAAALVRVAAGVVSDRWRRHKEVAAIGYGLSAVTRVLLLAAGNAWVVIAGLVAIDRIGKGVRTAPRDALISLRSPCSDLATAFGVHRALDAGGAMLGPLLAFVVLFAMAGRFDVLFVISFAMAAIGLGVILFFVDPTQERAKPATAPLTTRRAFDVWRAPRFRAILIAGFMLGLPTMSDSFVFLTLQQRYAITATAFPLFYVGTSLFMALFAVPFGRLADRAGRTRVLLGGYGALVLVYVTLFAAPANPIAAVLPIALLGAYYAATDGVLTAMAAATLPQATAGTGLALLATATNVSRLFASVLFGFIWSRVGLSFATSIYLAGLVLAIVAAGVVLLRADQQSAPAAD